MDIGFWFVLSQDIVYTQDKIEIPKNIYLQKRWLLSPSNMKEVIKMNNQEEYSVKKKFKGGYKKSNI